MRCSRMNRLLSMLLVLIACSPLALSAAELEISPFRTSNQSPLVQIFGLPADTTTVVTSAGHLSVSLTQDVASEYTTGMTANEQITLDGESYRWVLAARYGINDYLEAGIDIPYILYGGGFLDGFIDDWHRTFGLPRGGRDTAAKNRLDYSYRKDGTQKLSMRRSGSGIGDVSLHGGLKLYERQDAGGHDRLALRASVKLPTGESGSLLGSGSTDFSLALSGSMNNYSEWGTLGVFGSAGGLAMTRGRVLPEQQNYLAAFGNAGLGWAPAGWIAFKVQLNAHTPLYHGSSLNQLSKSSLLLAGGGTLRFPDEYLLDIGVSEDLAVSTSPDVAFHLGLHKQF